MALGLVNKKNKVRCTKSSVVKLAMCAYWKLLRMKSTIKQWKATELPKQEFFLI